ncbi:MAG: hypothetical protein QM759_18105 [Terricaulis sp.]
MRAIAFLIAALALAACVQREGPTRPQGAGDACNRTATHQVTWSSADDADTVSAQSEGPSCAQAVVTLVVRNTHGDPLWVFANTYYDLRTGGVPPVGVAPPAVSAEDMQKFLQSFANVTRMQSSQLPDWAEGAAGPADASRPFHYSTAYPRYTYEALRASNRALICYAAAAEATQCLVMDPASNAPAVIVAFGP